MINLSSASTNSILNTLYDKIKENNPIKKIKETQDYYDKIVSDMTGVKK